jgi:enoyl-CoA hydratase/carnithine racemase
VIDEIAVSSADGIGRIRIERPAKKNAITTAMYDAMADALDAFVADDGVRTVIVSGGADFTAGNDLQDFIAASMSGKTFEELPVIRFLERLMDFPKPIVAAVRGNAIGIGTTMLLHTDVAVASETARFRVPFAQLGLVPEAASSLLLPLTVGRTRAAWLFMSGEIVSAPEALALGLVTKVAPDEATDATATEIAGRLATLPPEAVRETKRLLRAPIIDQVKHQFRLEVEAFTQRLASDEFRAAAMKLLSR